MLVAICVASYCRPEGLKRLLDGLNQLNFRKCETPEIQVIVVDNDANGSAKAVCNNQLSQFKWSLQYSIQTTRGISFARNHAIALALSISNHVDFIAFIDDDEVPEQSWLDELLSTQKTYQADVVTGPVIPQFIKSDVPNWVVKGKFFEPKRYPTGHILKTAFTNNVLIRTQVIRQLDTIFDESFALTGGEDSHFFMRLYRSGHKFVWTDEAIVTEYVPQSRTNVKWVLERGYLGWSLHSYCERQLYPSINVVAVRIIKGIALITQGLCLIFPSLFLGEHALVKALLHIYRGVGTLAGILGIRYEAYKVTHGV
ncbi:glycosyltransferase family 2 protein [Calothrix sp. PCC 6303]|uniref:glycosyltransferase family 2 protein n=1 Tax=Calothrix sp. PCC 6303 TaxID=1170562 RepID=UPI0002A03DC1|nr:glycosyltransferase family 2 protein [Calothrix sp. PCC 6303]AFZ03443.1 glycosyl transferase family 2 [Calothrix sp. PCC 6303]